MGEHPPPHRRRLRSLDGADRPPLPRLRTPYRWHRCAHRGPSATGAGAARSRSRGLRRSSVKPAVRSVTASSVVAFRANPAIISL